MSISDDGRPSVAAEDEALWRGALLGTSTELKKARRFWKHLPSDPRCKMCWSPFAGLGGVLARLTLHGPQPRNPTMCGFCARELRQHPGGAEIELSVLFADIRDSTTVAESMAATAYRMLLERFYRVASEAITTHDGIIDKFLGDGVMALFIPAFTGEGHAGRAVDAARNLLRRVDHMPERLPVGIGVHTGTAFAGVVGTDDQRDFSALGDAVNVAARLGSLATANQVLVSVPAARAAGVNADHARPLELKGRHEPLDVIEL
ncbi:MAG: adenylate/guanylate cyclase domain-containing protein [Candidatus Limnocylindria bacterium]